MVPGAWIALNKSPLLTLCAGYGGADPEGCPEPGTLVYEQGPVRAAGVAAHGCVCAPCDVAAHGTCCILETAYSSCGSAVEDNICE